MLKRKFYFFLKEWKNEGVLFRENEPAIYVYHQIYEVGGKTYTRKGFMCRCEAVPFGQGMVFPHEETMSGPKMDRLMLTTACKTNFSQIFGLYPDGGDANLTVAASSSLVLTDTLSGKIGVRRDVGSDMAVFGRVDESFSGTDADFVSSAMNFTSDDDNAYGLAVRSADGTTLLVWSTRLGDGNTYTDGDGVVYTLVSVGSTPFPVDRPTGASLVYTGEEQTGVQSGRGYTLSGDVSATDCGSYSATATLAAGYVWSDDGGTDAMEITWSITKATYDLSGITFENATYTYDGTPKRIEISGDLPDGVTVEYLSPDGNDWTQPGEYNVIARFTGDDNHESIPDMTATLKIVTDEPTPPEPPEPDPDPAQPEDVAFISVSLADATWTVAFTNAVEKCWYSLYETNSLAGGFKIDGVEPVTVRQATATDVPTMTFERPASGSQLFWRLVAEPEDAH